MGEKETDIHTHTNKSEIYAHEIESTEEKYIYIICEYIS